MDTEKNSIIKKQLFERKQKFQQRGTLFNGRTYRKNGIISPQSIEILAYSSSLYEGTNLSCTINYN